MASSVLFRRILSTSKKARSGSNVGYHTKQNFQNKLCFDENDERLNTQINSIAIYPLIKLTLILPDF